jgi:hypothetical protein
MKIMNEDMKKLHNNVYNTNVNSEKTEMNEEDSLKFIKGIENNIQIIDISLNFFFNDLLNLSSIFEEVYLFLLFFYIIIIIIIVMY